VNENIVKNVFRTRKIKLNPTKEQKLKLNSYADGARYTYNTAIKAINSGKYTANKIELQNAFVSLKRRDGTYNFFFDKRRWLLQTPKVIRHQAMFEAVKNFKAAFASLKNKNIDHFKISFKTKKHQRQYGYSLGITKSLKFRNSILTILPETIGKMKFFGKMPFEGVPEAECRIRRDPYGDFWLLVPVKKTTSSSSGPIVAIDPGVRTPFACFSTDGTKKTLGEDMNERLNVIRTKISLNDRRFSKATTNELRKKCREHRRFLYRQHQRVRDAYHWRIINDITSEAGGVLLPPFETQKLSGMLKAKTNRSLLGISHFTFRMRMKERCDEKTLLYEEPTEEYTSKTCGSCGRINFLLGSKKTFECFCGVVCDRDTHAARNILLKWLSTTEMGARVLATFPVSRST
jgi:transposase